MPNSTFEEIIERCFSIDNWLGYVKGDIVSVHEELIFNGGAVAEGENWLYLQPVIKMVSRRHGGEILLSYVSIDDIESGFGLFRAYDDGKVLSFTREQYRVVPFLLSDLELDGYEPVYGWHSDKAMREYAKTE